MVRTQIRGKAMSEVSKNPNIFRAEQIRQLPEQSIKHPLNPNSEIHGVSLSDLVGFQRLGFHLIRIPPQKESFVYHSHQSEEEFVYILSGRGIAEIDGEEYEVGAGDFMGFPTPSVAHHLRNPFDEDLVYLSGGERHDLEIVDFPKLNKRVFFKSGKAQMVDVDKLDPLWG
jgi:uncharacterized cupin superfamily protein